MDKISDMRVKISTAEWVSPAIERIAKLGDDLIEIGVPRGTVHQLCKEVMTHLAVKSTTVELPPEQRTGDPRGFLFLD